MTIEEKIRELADKYSTALAIKMSDRETEMGEDDNAHYLIYYVLGVSAEEGQRIDVYQNKGRFLYKYAGSFLEEAAIECFLEKYPKASKKAKVPNTLGARPKTFEIDCLVNQRNDAIEIKWRDATTDGDHITKEHTRIQVIKGYGYKPIRVMFYDPNRDQAIKIQETLATLYQGVNGEYHSGENAWTYIHEYTGVNLKEILEIIAKENLAKMKKDTK